MPTFEVGMKVVDKQADRNGIGEIKEVTGEGTQMQITVYYPRLANMEPSPMPEVLYSWGEAVDSLVVIEEPK